MIERSIRWRLLFYITGIVIVMRITISIVHMQGDTAMINRALEQVKASMAGSGGEAAHIDIASIEQSLENARYEIFFRESLVAAAILGLLIFLLLHISKSITRPVIQLTHAVTDMANGKETASSTLPVDVKDEVGDLARAFSVLSTNLKSARQEIENRLIELSKAEKRLNLFFHNATDMLAIKDFDGHFLDINDAYAQALGYTREEMLGKSCYQMFHPDDFEASIEKLIDLKAGRTVLGFENRMRHKNGSYRRIGWNIASDPITQRIYVIGWDVTEERTIEEEIIRATAAEQERMAHDLHDSVGQMLTGLAFKAKLIENDLISTGSSDPARVSGIVKLANRIIEETRSIARGIDPVELQRGLASSLEYLTLSTREIFGVDCHFDQNGDDHTVERPTAVHLYRIAQEAVNNSIRHGKASEIRIQLRIDNKQLQLSIQDNGIGEPQILAPDSGSGIRIMKYRARMIGGDVTFLSNMTGGRIIKCSIPIRARLSYSDGRGDRDFKEERGAI